MQRVLIVGATAAMVRETARRFAADGRSLALAARDPVRLAALAEELRGVGAASVVELAFDAEELVGLAPLFDRAVRELGGLDALLVAHGELTNQRSTEADAEEFLRSLNVNGLSAALLLHRAANLFEQQGSGCLCVISSGAGERGRRSTYTYGMAKSLVTAQLQGLRARLSRHGISVVTVLPCFVDTPMTAYLPKRLRWISAEAAGRRIHRAMERGTDLVYIPRVWRLALFVARNLPEWWVKRSRAEERFLAELEREAAEREDRNP